MKATIKYLYLGAAALMGLASCSDDFLEEKKLWGKLSEQTAYTNVITATERVDNLYYMVFPGQKEGNGMYGDIVSFGLDDMFAKTTEEYGGVSDFENSTLTLELSEMKNYDHFYVENKETSPYGHVREINDVLENLQKYGPGNIEEKDLNGLLGQAYFLRAWRYWNMVKWYGGVPIIDHVQNALVGNGEGLDLVVPRSSTKECIDFIIADIDKAASLLPAKWDQETENWGRVTAGTALALKGRILLTWASPLWNRGNDPARWQAAYEANKAAVAKLTEGGYGLAYENNAGAETESAANWARMFLNTKGSDGSVNEAVFVTLYNNVQKQNNTNRWNGWESAIRPKNAAANGGGKHPTAEMVDLFPMADGKKPGESQFSYDEDDKLTFFANRDPRFYRTFAFPGVNWKFNGQPKSKLTQDDKDAVTFGGGLTLNQGYPFDGGDYVLWSYSFYTNEDKQEEKNTSGYGAFGLGSMSGRSSVYIRKRSDDYEINGSPLYTWEDGTNASTDGNGFQRSAAPFMEMRFAEVLLNLAECAASTGKDAEAFEILKRIRSRVYDAKYADTDFGLERLSGGALMAQILFERQIELAYEGKRFDDMRRWLLFDGGVGHETTFGSQNYKLTGWGGNTCEWLGVKPTNGREKYHYIEIYAQEEAKEEAFKADPILADMKTPTGIDLNKRLETQSPMLGFYFLNLARKDKYAEGNDDAVTIQFNPRYYIWGFDHSGLVNNPTLYQTMGWEDESHGGMGIFDPLETDAAKIPVDTDTGYKK